MESSVNHSWEPVDPAQRASGAGLGDQASDWPPRASPKPTVESVGARTRFHHSSLVLLLSMMIMITRPGEHVQANPTQSVPVSTANVNS